MFDFFAFLLILSLAFRLENNLLLLPPTHYASNTTCYKSMAAATINRSCGHKQKSLRHSQPIVHTLADTDSDSDSEFPKNVTVVIDAEYEIQRVSNSYKAHISLKHASINTKARNRNQNMSIY